MNHPSEAHMKATLQEYVDALNRGDLDAVMALYDDEATVEDPVGTPVRKGHAEIAALYQQALDAGFKLKLVAPIRASHGDAAAMAFDSTGSVTVRVIDVMRFNPDGKIRSMQAFWGPGDLSAVPA